MKNARRDIAATLTRLSLDRRISVFVLLIVGATVLTGGGDGPSRSTPEPEPTGVPLGCLSLGAVTEQVPCGDHDAVVWSVVEAAESCPDGLDSVYRQGVGGLFCITRTN